MLPCFLKFLDSSFCIYLSACQLSGGLNRLLLEYGNHPSNSCLLDRNGLRQWGEIWFLIMQKHAVFYIEYRRVVKDALNRNSSKADSAIWWRKWENSPIRLFVVRIPLLHFIFSFCYILRFTHNIVMVKCVWI